MWLNDSHVLLLLILFFTLTLVTSESCSSQGNCFILSQVRTSTVWDAAEHCNMKNAILAELTDESERLEIMEALGPALTREPFIYLGMNDLFHEGRWVLQGGKEFNASAMSDNLNNHCSAIKTDTHAVIRVPCALSQPKVYSLCQVKHNTGCFNDAPDYTGFTKVSTTDGRNYGSVVKYTCSGIYYYSRCFGSLGWDVRDLVKQQCTASRVNSREQEICNYNGNESESGLMQRRFELNAVQLKQQITWQCTKHIEAVPNIRRRLVEDEPYCCQVTLYGDAGEPPKKTSCPDGFRKIANKCFRLFKHRVTNAWDAADRCYAKDAVLAEIPDYETLSGVVDYLKEEKMDGEIAIFLGMNDIREEGVWRLYNGSVLPLPGSGVYTPLSYKVDNWLDAEDCSSIQPSEGYIINDIPCTIQLGINDWPTFYPPDLPFLCEYKGTTKCAMPPLQQVSGFTLQRYDESLTYGSSASYTCSGTTTVTSRCFGTLGWKADQLECKENNCRKWDVQCDDGNCVHYTKRCDGSVDCPDGSDEKQSVCDSLRLNCSFYHFPCYDGTCVMETEACNGNNDCPDGSDEDQEYCERNCGGAKFKCPNGNCIRRISMCDTIDDCGDGSDEHEATCASYKCTESEFKCGTWGICIPGNRTCDGDDNCYDGGSDEDPSYCEDCGMRFKCPNGRCIPQNYLCDGNKNCGCYGGSNCGYDEIPNICQGEQMCGKGQFRCNNTNCISATLMCNEEDDCGDNSDEPELCSAPSPWPLTAFKEING